MTRQTWGSTFEDALHTALAGLLGDYADDYDTLHIIEDAYAWACDLLPEGWVLHDNGTLTGPAGQPVPDVLDLLGRIDLAWIAARYDLTQPFAV